MTDAAASSTEAKADTSSTVDISKPLPPLFESVEVIRKKHSKEIASVRSKLTEGKVDDDIIIFRFLKGHKFDESKVVPQINAMLKFRRECKMDDIRAKAVKMKQSEFPYYDKLIRAHPHNISHKQDRHGQPMSIERMGRANPQLLVQTMKLQDLVEYHKYHMENKAALAAELTEKTGTVVRMCKIIDLDGLGVRHSHRAGLRYFKHVLQWTQDCYPEMLGTLYVVNAPWIFKTLWAVVKPWLNEATLSKIQILGSDYHEVLKKNVDPANLPTWLGGTCNCEGGCVVELDPDEGLTPVEIKARATHEVKVDADEKGSVIAWEFRTKEKDLGFAVTFTPTGSSAKQEVLANKRYNCHEETVNGMFEVKEPGTLILQFDNTYSMFTSKNLLFRVDKTKPEAPSVDSPKDGTDAESVSDATAAIIAGNADSVVASAGAGSSS